MTSNRFLLFALLLLTAAASLPAQPPTPGAPPVDVQPQKRTVQDIRSVGTAMWAWLSEEIQKNPVKAQAQDNGEKKPVPTTAPFGEVPLISRAELTKLLVPRYIAYIPETDGWGHPYEYRLNVNHPLALHVMGVRSPGQDGQFSAETYEIGGFPYSEMSQDLAWIDGYFVRWPEAKQPAK